MFRHCAVLVSLALVAAFLSAPYEHVHTTTDVRHSHVTPHDGVHQHGTPDMPDHTPHGKDDVLKANIFLSPAPGATAGSVVAVTVAPSAVIDLEPAPREADVDESRAHGPPATPRSPRAPPVLPAF